MIVSCTCVGRYGRIGQWAFIAIQRIGEHGQAGAQGGFETRGDGGGFLLGTLAIFVLVFGAGPGLHSLVVPVVLVIVL
jgi:hypothetical protein